MQGYEAAKALGDALNPLLVRAGFAKAQIGFDSDGGTGMTFCTAFAEFTERYPWLPQADDDWAPCTDLVIDLDPTGRIQRFTLEFEPVSETLEQIARPEAALVAARVSGATAVEAVPDLLTALSELFGLPIESTRSADG